MLYDKDKHKIRKSGLRWQEWDRYIVNSELGSIPSLDTMSIMLMQYFLDKMKDKYAKSSPSDGADIIHAAYAPYCDILRADKRIVEITNKISRFFNLKETMFLKNPEDLPQAIKEKARSRGFQPPVSYDCHLPR
jgi:hypothetical protein